MQHQNDMQSGRVLLSAVESVARKNQFPFPMPKKEMQGQHKHMPRHCIAQDNHRLEKYDLPGTMVQQVVHMKKKCRQFYCLRQCTSRRG